MKLNKSKPPDSATKVVVGAAALGSGILIVEDHSTMREGLIRVIERESDLRVAGQASSAARALEFLASSEPALVLLDISLGDDSGIELIKDIKIRHPQLAVLVHSMHEDSVYAGRALRAGAKGYVAKGEPTENLLQAIREVLRGEIYLNEVLTK